MGLSVAFTITQNSGCGSLVFDDTSVYGDGGSGNNPSYDDIGSTKIVFSFTDSNTVTIDTWKPTEEIPSLTLYAADLNYTGIIPDQEVENIVYTVYDTGGNVLGTRSSPYLLSCNFISCFYGQIEKVALDNCCNKADLDRLTTMWMRYIGIQTSFEQNSGCVTGGIEALSAECSKFCFNNCNTGCQ